MSESQHLYTKLTEYAKTDAYPYHMPGHKRRISGNMPKPIMEMDITEITDFDDLHHPEGILASLQEKAARLYGAEESFYLVNGSTCGVQAAISAALSVGGHLLMARNCHKSAYHTVYLRGLQVTYLYPPIMDEFGIFDAPTPAQVEEALQKDATIQAVLIVSPSYEGRIADVTAIAQIVHRKGLPLIVDEAHGAHLGLAEGFAKNSCQAGADLVIHSVHKTLPALTQTALLHVNGPRIDRDRLRRFLQIYQTSSPSYVLMASIDNALELVSRSEQGAFFFERFRTSYKRMLEQLSACRVLTFPGEGTSRQDIGKLVIYTGHSGLTGRELADRLREEYHLELELAAEQYALAMFTVGDSPEGYERMTRALLAIDRTLEPWDQTIGKSKIGTQKIGNQKTGNQEMKVTHGSQARPAEDTTDYHFAGEECTVIPLATAWDLPAEEIELEQAQDRVAAAFIQLYPPGVPIVVPGELLTKNKYDTIVTYLAKNLNVQGLRREGEKILVKVLTNRP